MKAWAVLALAAAGASWGLGFPLGKLVLREMGAAHMVALRFAAAAAVAAPFVLLRRESWMLFRSPAVIAAGAFYGLAFLLQFEGLAQVSVSLAALLIGGMPALVAICAWMMGDRLGRQAWVGVVIAVLGAALLAGKPQGAGTPLGIALSIGALFVFLGWQIAIKRAPAGSSPLAIAAASILVGSLVVLPVALIGHGPLSLDYSWAAWAAVIGQGLVSTLFATAAWHYGASRLGIATAGVFINIEPLLGATLGVMLFGDRLTLALLLGGLMILVGSGLVVFGEHGGGRLTPDPPATPA